MSEFYKSNRTRNLYDPKSKEPFKLSRSRIESFIHCPKCFYLDRRLGVGQPDMRRFVSFIKYINFIMYRREKLSFANFLY